MIIQPFLMVITICVVYLMGTSNTPNLNKHIACWAVVIAYAIAVFTGVASD